MRGPAKPLIVSILVIVLLVVVLLWDSGPLVDEASLLLYCAAGMKMPIAAVATQYEQEYGVPVRIQYGGSGTLLSNLRISGAGDLYLAADSSYIDLARGQGLVAEALSLAHMRPVIAVAKGNPKGIASVDDLLQSDVKVALGSPDAASIGQTTQILLEQRGAWASLEQAAQTRGVFKLTVNEVANDVKIGAVDAGIVWDATVNQYPELESVPIAGSEEVAVNITVGVLNSTKQPTAALRFARYMAARDRGLLHFEQHGFPPVDGDVWAEEPMIVYYSGGVNRLAIQDTIRAFEEREGVQVATAYNGCGILVGQMKLGDRPDAYHTCDLSFMAQVEDLFLESTNLSETDMVILVGKDNPLGIEELADLGAEGLRLGLANEQQSALGALTARMLRKMGLYEAVTKNVVTRTPTADLLVNQIRTGSLDAVIVYEANTVVARDHLDLIRIAHPSAKAVQSFAVGKNSDHKQLLGRLFDSILSTASQERFQLGGFRWLGPSGTL
jgi:molybdate transport system substrate-binding protein